MQCLNQCCNSARKCDKASQMCSRKSAADSDVKFMLNLISLIEFDTAEMQHINRALLIITH